MYVHDSIVSIIITDTPKIWNVLKNANAFKSC